MPATRTTRINGSASSYCTEHKPPRLVAFQEACLRALLVGTRRRNSRKVRAKAA
jgi:hypothetical protein